MKEKYMGTGGGKEIRHLAQKILMAFLNDELILIVVHGKQGYGKSTYASMIAAQVYGIMNNITKYVENNPSVLKGLNESKIRVKKLTLLKTIIENNEPFEYDWNTTQKYFVFKPRQFLTLSAKQKKKAPLAIVDDAGLWLNAMDFQNPIVKAVGKFFEVARTRWGAILFTCSDLNQIFSKLRNMPHVFTVKITKHTHGGEYVDRRAATIYEGWSSEDLKKRGTKTKAIDMFYAKMPGEENQPNTFYGWYKPKREKLTREATDELEKVLDDLEIYSD